MERRRLVAEGLLLLAAGIWGFAFVAQRIGMQHVGPFLFNAVRFALGSLVLVPVIRWRRVPIPACGAIVRGSLAAGAILFGGASLQQVGIISTTAGKAGFITGLYVVLVPLCGPLLGRRSAPSTWLGAGTAAVGLYLLSVEPDFTIGPGDALVLVGAFFWTAHVLVIDRLVTRLDWAALACGQFAVCAVLSLAVALLTEPFQAAGLKDAAGAVFYGGVLSVGVAYTLQVAAQRHTPPAHAAILLSLETVFAALGGWLILDEGLTPRALGGCGLMLLGTVIAQLGTSTRSPLQPSPSP
ncbi:MAG: DMT family transporter [Candidatus Latescibacterota bacterium]